MQREDAYSGPLVFSLTPMGKPTLLELSQQYFDAADTLVESIKKQRIEDYKVAYPTLYLYRHSIELILKFITDSNESTHNLNTVTDNFIAYVSKNHNQSVPNWIKESLKELAKTDPTSTAFRYAEDKYNGKKHPPSSVEDVYVYVVNFQLRMTELYKALYRVATYFAKTSTEQLIKEMAKEIK
ncbi:hypothetical protein [Methylophilus medardicus]|uniref:HEPN domain-containing protein n=1 Tax=Methylophilus medardicus TaxID=2588534 RepID=A0A5B8CU11_9PROT|nr:hypothetical protein [Methylophilus medardicus]QDC44600.1 hypothetical protein FIU01_08700 [Methylophilus medardicus]QDC49607.1 hypothetical protein FIU00_08700 [Methylophilus medardicus]QDC53312.1 hypothetical protein FIT99_08700 [Methylophilus medardicus]